MFAMDVAILDRDNAINEITRMYMKRNTGYYTTISTVGEKARAFVPSPLPPDPAILISSDIRRTLDSALIALGRLDSASAFIPDINLLLYLYIRKEAVLSSQIEGTQSSLSDLLLFELSETPGVTIDDVKEVSNYVAALTHGMERLKNGFPLSNRLVREMHEILLSSGRGSEKQPGEFRKSQNWIGGTCPGNAVFIPPPPELLIECMSDLEKFLNSQTKEIGIIEKAALAHAQFETIHPFLDGNGRIGRLLITLLLYHDGVLSLPLLYLSLYFKTNRSLYYEHLRKIRSEGNWESWILFFAQAVVQTAEQCTETAKKLIKLIADDQRVVLDLGRISGSVTRVFQEIIKRPVTDMTYLVKTTGLVPNTVLKVLKTLETTGIMKEITGKNRNRAYAYVKYIEIMNQGAEPL